MAELIIGPSLAIGVILGSYEAIMLIKDVDLPRHKLWHAIQAVLFSIVFVFAVMNVELVFSLIPQLVAMPVIGNPHIFRITIGLLAVIKLHAVSRASPGMTYIPGVKTAETWFHSILIGGLIIASHYAYPFIDPVLPSWIKF